MERHTDGLVLADVRTAGMRTFGLAPDNGRLPPALGRDIKVKLNM